MERGNEVMMGHTLLKKDVRKFSINFSKGTLCSFTEILLDVFDNLMLVIENTTNERKTEGKPHTLVAIT